MGNALLCLKQPHPRPAAMLLLTSHASQNFLMASCRMNLLLYQPDTPLNLKIGALSVNRKMKWFYSAFCFVHVISNRLFNKPQMNFCLSHFRTECLLHLQCRRVSPALRGCSLQSWQQFVRPLSVTTSPITCFILIDGECTVSSWVNWPCRKRLNTSLTIITNVLHVSINVHKLSIISPPSS